MALARHGSGSRAALDAYASQVHPIFMLPPIASSWFGSVLAGEFTVPVGALHMAAIFAAVYTAHVKDGYIDFHVRGEDDDHPLSVVGCRLGLAASTLAFAVAVSGLWLLVGLGAVALTLPTWLIAYHHAPQLDMHPVGATMGYPAGIALAILGGYYVQTGQLTPAVLGFGAVFLVLLSGVKIVDDAQDYDYDHNIGKRTVAVVLGPERARRFAFALMAVSLGLVAALASQGVFPPSTALAVLPFGIVGAIAHRADPELATKLLIRGAYVFLAVLVAAVWWQPLA